MIFIAVLVGLIVLEPTGHGSYDMGGGNMGMARSLLAARGSVSKPLGIRTQKPLPKGPVFGGAFGEGLLIPWQEPQRPNRTANTCMVSPLLSPRRLYPCGSRWIHRLP